MEIQAVLEYNRDGSLLWAENLPGAFARGVSPEEAAEKLSTEVRRFLQWRDGSSLLCHIPVQIVSRKESSLQICDADSDILLESERMPLSAKEYEKLKTLVLRSAADFQRLFDAVPDPDDTDLPERKTFYGNVPRTARQMYAHTNQVSNYYAGELGADFENLPDIRKNRALAFERIEALPGFLENRVIEGSYGELWNLRKVLRRFLWHDRIHAKALWRMAGRIWEDIPDPFCFGWEPQCRFAPVNSLGNYQYAILIAKENGQFLWCRQKGKTTWEIPGGHIEPGESPAEAARRELFEETGAEDFTIRPIFDCEAGGTGVVFLAEVFRRGEIPESEMEEVRLADEIPGEWSWPCLHPRILAEYRRLFESAKPAFLYHGSTRQLTRLEPQPANGLAEENGAETAVYAYETPEACKPFALHYLPDDKGNLSVQVDDVTHQIRIFAGSVDWNQNSWIYKLPADTFVRLDMVQWVSYEPVEPVETMPFRAEDYWEMVEDLL